jgi:hypothetical protein
VYSEKRKFSLHPRDRDVVLHCRHLDRLGFHYWLLPRKKFVRQNGSLGTAKWLMCCIPCFTEANGNPARVRIQDCAHWKGDEPCIMDLSRY